MMVVVNGIKPEALHYLRSCGLCGGAWRLQSETCPNCKSTGVTVCKHVPVSSYLAGAESLHDVIVRIMLQMNLLRERERVLLDQGHIEGAVIEAARRSGMAEVASALDMWITTHAAIPQQRKGAS